MKGLQWVQWAHLTRTQVPILLAFLNKISSTNPKRIIFLIPFDSVHELNPEDFVAIDWILGGSKLETLSEVCFDYKGKLPLQKATNHLQYVFPKTTLRGILHVGEE